MTGVIVVARAGIKPPWGGSISVGYAPHKYWAGGSNWQIYRGADDVIVGLAWNGEKTHTYIDKKKDPLNVYRWAIGITGAKESPTAVAYWTAQGKALRGEKEEEKKPPAKKPAPKPAYVEFSTTCPSTVNAGSPFKHEITPGRHTMTLSAKGYKQRTWTMVWAEGSSLPGQSFGMVKEAPPTPEEDKQKEAEKKAEEKAKPTAPGDLGKGLAEGVEALAQGIYYHPWVQGLSNLLEPLEEWFSWDIPHPTKGTVKVFFLGPGLVANLEKALGKATGQTVTKAILKETGKAIRGAGTKRSKELATAINKLPEQKVGELLYNLEKIAGDKQAADIIYRLGIAKIPVDLQKVLVKGTAVGLTGSLGVLGLGSFLGFSLEEAEQRAVGATIGLINAGKYKEANETWPGVKQILEEMKQKFDTFAKAPILGIGAQLFWQSWRDSLDVEIAGIEKQIQEGLQKEATGTTLNVATNTDPAFMHIQGILPPTETPATVNIQAGDYSLVTEKKGYVTDTRRIIVKDKQDNVVTIELKPVSKTIATNAGRLAYEVLDNKTGAHIGAAFYINNRLERAYAHAYSVDLKPGTYELSWSAIGYRPYEDTITIDKDKTTDLTVEMQKIEVPLEAPEGVTCESLGYHTDKPQDGQEYEQTPVRGMVCWKRKEENEGALEILTEPAANVHIAGELIQQKTPLRIELTQGVYDVLLTREGYKDHKQTVYVRAGEVSRLSFNLVKEEEPPAPRVLASININSNPTGAKILINGEFTGKYTPDTILLEPGDYELTLTKTGFVPWTTPLRLLED